MRQIDRLILREIVGPWVFGVALFSALLMAGLYLNKIAEFAVRGASPMMMLQFIALLTPGLIVKTFTMAMLLAGLLAFGRLSSDSEIVALRAGGASLFRIVAPVIAFSAMISAITFVFNEKFVPPAANRAAELLIELANKKTKAAEVDPVAFPIIDKGSLRGFVMAKAPALASNTLREVTLVVYGKDGAVSYYINAPELEYRVDLDGTPAWHIRGDSQLLSADGRTLMTTNEVWPQDLPRATKSPLDLLKADNVDPDIYSMGEIAAKIARDRAAGDVPPKRIRNEEYWYWNKISVPLAALIFGTLGAVLGVRNHRTGTATGFALAIGIIFGYFVLINFMAVWAQGGILPSWVASFAPLMIGLVASGVIMVKRNA